MNRIAQGYPVRVHMRAFHDLAFVPLDRVPPEAVVGTGVVVNNSMPPPYIYCVAVDGIEPGRDGQGNRYLYRESEVRLAEA